MALPPRDYELASRLLADAIEESGRSGVEVRRALDDVAEREGRRIGGAMRDRLGRRRSDRSARRAVVEVLAEHGFEPEEAEDGTVVLRNCPFHRLAQTHTELICGMNHCLVGAAIDELGTAPIDARLEPAPDTCCVRLHDRRAAP